MTADEFRKLALAFPGAVESAHMNHPDFRVGGRIFATLGVPDEEWGMVKLTPDQQQAFMEQAGGVFKPCSGTWGERGATHIHLPSAGPRLARTVLSLAKDNVAAPGKTRR